MIRQSPHAGVVLDSSVLIDVERHQLDLDPIIAIAGDQEAFLSAVTVSELWHGVHRARDATVRDRRSAFVRNIVTQFSILPVDESVAEEHARLWASLEEQGAMIGMNDTWIAATVMANGMAIVTANSKEFTRIQGLSVLEYTSGRRTRRR